MKTEIITLVHKVYYEKSCKKKRKKWGHIIKREACRQITLGEGYQYKKNDE